MARVIGRLLDTIKDALVWWFLRLGEWVLDFATGLIEATADLGVIPPEYLDELQNWLREINYVFPLYEVVGMAATAVAFYAAVSTTRFLLKIIPGVGY